MPAYDYHCDSCGGDFEFFQSMSEPPLTDCPECEQPRLRRLISNAGVIFKGSGFYVTDSKKSGASKKKSTEGTEAAPQKSGSDAKGESGGGKPGEAAAPKA